MGKSGKDHSLKMCPKWGMSFFIIWMQLNEKTFFTEFIQEGYSDG